MLTIVPRRNFRIDPEARRSMRLDTTLDAFCSHEHPDLLRRIQEVRTPYVRALGWSVPGELDQDGYDQRDDTIHLVKWKRDRGGILASMRLTPVQEWTESLSLRQLEAAPALHEQGLQHLKRLLGDTPQRTWDLTRLVHPLYGARPEQVLDGIGELVGMGIEATAGADDAWVLLLTPEMKDAFAQIGLPPVVLAGGRVSETDHYDTLLCVVYPARVLAAASRRRRSSRTLEHVARGRRFIRGVRAAYDANGSREQATDGLIAV